MRGCCFPKSTEATEATEPEGQKTNSAELSTELLLTVAGSDSPRLELLPTRTRSDLVETLHGEWARTVYSLRTEELSSERAVGVIEDKMEDAPVTILSTKLVQGQEMKDLDSDSLVEQDVEIVIRDRARLYVDICRSRASR